ncbi:hypothetical protein U1Q18_052473 [Sarracenia purpurea var. burkii]
MATSASTFHLPFIVNKIAITKVYSNEPFPSVWSSKNPQLVLGDRLLLVVIHSFPSVTTPQYTNFHSPTKDETSPFQVVKGDPTTVIVRMTRHTVNRFEPLNKTEGTYSPSHRCPQGIHLILFPSNSFASPSPEWPPEDCSHLQLGKR